MVAEELPVAEVGFGELAGPVFMLGEGEKAEIGCTAGMHWVREGQTYISCRLSRCFS